MITNRSRPSIWHSLRDWFSDLRHGSRRQIDYVLLGVLLSIVIIGLIVLFSASSVVSFQGYGESGYYLRRQIIVGVIPGLILLWAASRMPYAWWRKVAVPFMILAIILMVATFIPGIGSVHRNVRSWINLGIFSFQPSELAKLALIIYFALWLEKRREHEVRTWSTGMAPFLIFLAFICGLLIKQPDLGTMIIIVFIAVCMFMLGGASFKQLLAITVGGALCILLLANLAPYQTERLTIFLHPEQDPQGIGYHVNQALLAIGAGGLWGRGLGQSVQKYNYLPEVQGDSIFAVMSEELGFVLTLGFLILFFYFLLRAWRVAQSAPDRFSQLLAGGIVSWFTFQTVLNIGGMLRIVPLTGLPLPFVSYGGTAMAINLMAVGVLLSISRHGKTAV